MHSMGKLAVVVLVCVITLRYTVFKLELTNGIFQKNNYESVIKAASKVATIEMLDYYDTNKLYDGVEKEARDIPVDFDAFNVFMNSMNKILGAQMETRLANVSNYEVPMLAAVTYRYIVGVDYSKRSLDENGNYTCDVLNPLGYNLLIEKGEYSLDEKAIEAYSDSGINLGISGKARENIIIEFTLGNHVYITHKCTDTEDDSIEGYKELEYSVKSNGANVELTNTEDTNKRIIIPFSCIEKRIREQYYLKKDGYNNTGEGDMLKLDSSIEKVRDYIIMENINQYLDMYVGSSINYTASNFNSGLRFSLDRGNYNNTGNRLIKESGMIAVIDVITNGTGKNNQRINRVVSFGGSALEYVGDSY